MSWLVFISVLLTFFVLPSIVSGKLRYYACYLLFFIMCAVSPSVVIPVMLIWPRNPKSIGLVSDVMSSLTGFLGISWVVRRRENLLKGEPAVVVANHQNVFDILGMQYLHRWMGTYTALAKKSILYMFPVGPLCWLSGVIMTDRENRESKIRAIEEAKTNFSQGRKIWFFVEGTRNKSGYGLLPFKKGAFRLAIDCQTTIIPIVYSPYYFIDHDKKAFKRGKVILSVLEPVTTTGLTNEDVDSLTNRIYQLMREEYSKLSREVNA